MSDLMKQPPMYVALAEGDETVVVMGIYTEKQDAIAAINEDARTGDPGATALRWDGEMTQAFPTDIDADTSWSIHQAAIDPAPSGISFEAREHEWSVISQVPGTRAVIEVSYFPASPTLARLGVEGREQEHWMVSRYPGATEGLDYTGQQVHSAAEATELFYRLWEDTVARRINGRAQVAGGSGA